MNLSLCINIAFDELLEKYQTYHLLKFFPRTVAKIYRVTLAFSCWLCVRIFLNNTQRRMPPIRLPVYDFYRRYKTHYQKISGLICSHSIDPTKVKRFTQAKRQFAVITIGLIIKYLNTMRTNNI